MCRLTAISDKNRTFQGVSLGLAYILIKLSAGDYCATHKLNLINVALTQHFENINNRFTDLTGFVNKRIDDLIAAPKQAA